MPPGRSTRQATAMLEPEAGDDLDLHLTELDVRPAGGARPSRSRGDQEGPHAARVAEWARLVRRAMRLAFKHHCRAACGTGQREPTSAGAADEPPASGGEAIMVETANESVSRTRKKRSKPGRALCACRCGCRRRPGRRIECPTCGHRVGPGCAPEPCWNAAANRCHMCVPYPQLNGQHGHSGDFKRSGSLALMRPEQFLQLQR